jgi:hypothetical protein
MGIIICEFIFSSYCTQNKTNSQSCHLPSLQCCFQLFGNVAHISVSWFWTSSWSGFKSGSKVTFSFLLQSEPMLGINKGIDKSINNLPTSSHIFRKLVREHTCLVCSIKRINNTLMGRVFICQNVITYLDWNFPSCRLSIFKP